MPLLRWKHLMILGTGALMGCAGEPIRPDPAAVAESRAVEFLKREVPAWSRENGCFSCHNNGDAARALYLAKRKGHRVPPNILADTTTWVSEPQRWDRNKGEPGFSDKRLANIQFAAALLAAANAGEVKNRRPLEAAARKLAADQADDGTWPVEPQNAVGSPATYGTALATWMAMRVLQETATREFAGPIQKARAWLDQSEPLSVPAAAVLLLTSDSKPPDGRHSSAPATGFATNAVHKTEASLSFIRRAQSQDGGWGPYPDSPPEPFDTALALLGLAEIRQTRGVNEMIGRGRAFLAALQSSDGSWPATTRPPGAESYAQHVSTTGWAALALLTTRE